MQINWLQLTEGPADIPVPTYGQYGGPNWSGGEVVGDNEPGNYSVPPEDRLDALFLVHDQAYDQPNTLLRAQADLLLIQGILEQPADEVTGEGDLYAGGAVLAMLYQIAVVNNHPELLLQVDVGQIVEGAIARIEEGSITPEPQEIAGFVGWLGTIGQALAASESPIAKAAAGAVLDLAGSLGSAPTNFQDVLTDEAIDFLQDAAPQLANAVETIVDGSCQSDVEQFLDDASDWLSDVTTHPIAPEPLTAIKGKFAFLEYHDLLI
ncbi:hypothetical protein [Microvirga splendida]|uniref:Uncharacterized protein n=1 Tax=Microvirga splendida TaxID=2795727 RepID=A0ABS0Y1L3_9HYPH|nr:hypothetical protein [Microvirga splendida]MBJ6125895.1 hypothetical protein [Microvirga splendida]